MLSAKVIVSVKGDPHLDRQTSFALASALTLTAKQAQPAVIKAIEGSFTVRTNWDKPANIFGVRIKPATKTDLVAIVGTAADWLEKFVTEPEGSFVVKLPQGTFLAIPTKNVRRTKRELIQKSNRPKALVGKRDFIIKTKKGIRILFQRRGRGAGSKLVALYVLYPKAKIREKDVLFGPTAKVFQRVFADLYAAQLQKAFATAR